MNTKFVMLDTVKAVEEKIMRVWVSGVGKEAEFVDQSQGWWASFISGGESVYLGKSAPDLKAGDHVRRILEKIV